MTTPAQAKATDKGRMYPLTPDDLVPSVTNITGVVNKVALVAGARKVQAETIFDNLDYYVAMIESKGYAKARLQASRDALKVWTDRADEGTRVHQAIADMIAGRHNQIPADLDQYMKHLDRWLMDATPTVVMSEVTVYHSGQRYAGTVDAIFELDTIEGTETVLCDVKTGGLWPEMALQLAALANCDFARLDDGSEIMMPRIDRCALLHLTPDKCELVPVQTGIDVFEGFLAARRLWDFMHLVAPKVLP